MKRLFAYLLVSLLFVGMAKSKTSFNGLDMNLGSLSRLSNVVIRSISPENLTGEKGKGGMARMENKDIPKRANAFNAARDLWQGWKVNPFVQIKSGQTFTKAEIEVHEAVISNRLYVFVPDRTSCQLSKVTFMSTP